MSERTSVLVTVAAVAVAVVVWLLVAGPHGSAGPDTSAAQFSTGDRNALGAAPVGRGATAAADPHVDLHDASAVSRAYVHAAYSLVPSDAGETNRRAVPYAAPGTPPNEVGVLVLDPPPPGRRTEAVVTSVVQVSGEPTGTRRDYEVGYHEVQLAADAPEPGPDDDAVTTTRRLTRHLLLTRQLDGRWLVSSDTTDAEGGAP